MRTLCSILEHNRYYKNGEWREVWTAWPILTWGEHPREAPWGTWCNGREGMSCECIQSKTVSETSWAVIATQVQVDGSQTRVYKCRRAL